MRDDSFSYMKPSRTGFIFIFTLFYTVFSILNTKTKNQKTRRHFYRADTIIFTLLAR